MDEPKRSSQIGRQEEKLRLELDSGFCSNEEKQYQFRLKIHIHTRRGEGESGQLYAFIKAKLRIGEPS